jgi:hypothetical protein
MTRSHPGGAKGSHFATPGAKRSQSDQGISAVVAATDRPDDPAFREESGHGLSYSASG